MPEIKVLDKVIANRIAAGEVVEKPASVVKELIENSLDAKAQNISVYIKEGGIRQIIILDDGTGIKKSEAETAFLPHATSKIQKIDDLSSISTLGFRGEALASIASVSEIELLTKTENEAIGTRLILSGGEVELNEDSACNKGTKIIINNLFFNTPARKKFLRKPKLEESEITKIIEKFILSKPTVKFKYYVDDKLIYNTMGSGLKDAIYTIYGKEVASNLIELNHVEKQFKITGFIGNTQISKPNRTYQTLFVNNRIVVNYLISSAIQSAYDDFLMKGQFPFYVLNLEVPFDSVDVNIHPTKQEVKFENTNQVYGLFARAVHSALIGIQHIKQLDSPTEQKPNIDLAKEFASIFSVSKPKNYSNELVFRSDNLGGTKGYASKTNNEKEINKTASLDNYNQIATQIFEELETAKPYSRVVGTLFSTYIIIEKENYIYLIDQHACHERKIYDNFIKELNSDKTMVTQELLVPYVFKCNQEEWQFFYENLDNFKKIGFNLEDFGDKTFIINEIPFIVNNLDLEKFITDVKSNLQKFNKTKLDLLKDFFAVSACKAAIKGGDNLSQMEIDALLRDLDEHKTLLCPHGRPIVIKISKTEIEKWFKRIV